MPLSNDSTLISNRRQCLFHVSQQVDMALLDTQVAMLANDPRYAKNQDRVRNRAVLVPLLGQHTEDVLSGMLNYSDEKLSELGRSEVI
ncbi:hypothetical protein [Polaromonas sp. JS666]|uniref:hypothetical protein n=1 Tax=Polaromonas sp. (strain JS666 / ATCC BAA-500) TaxID=296591 RepID=UPI000053478F|nr:hypothetical protein [Polaromonas sp. JS666]ABE42244.1 hypothetical protein Bpro_0279 [Polaromonas sp. JS666]